MRSHDSPSLFSLVPLARSMRKAPTRSEALLWRHLCGKYPFGYHEARQLGVRVRRQHPLHPYIADFYVPSYKLVVEVDGGIHRALRERDRVRDAELARLYGVRVLRIDAELVERDVYAAVALVRAALR